MIILAYVDPGLGLLAWQAIVATFVGLLFYIKKTRNWVVDMIRKPFRRASESAPVILEAQKNEVGQ
ncbi:MAG TPA: hypothetical protein VLT36_14640 [Candidatus Dormibacteraeota bacterium]|nr:hypothetical protein [Candidatus Dormibacteraeota bacterium]